ncbi:MAG: M48 family metallopeptidase [Nanoarchaeota archaeon]
MVQKLSFEDQITKNKLKSVLLMVIIIAFFIALGYAISQVFDPSYFFIIMIISIIFSLSYTVISYYNSDKIALASVRAKPASQTHHRMFFHAAESMSIASGLPMPRLYVMDSPEINAFASGRDPKHAVICMTTSSLEKLSKQELEGVIAHEMSHIANFDIRFMTLTAVLIGLISIIAELFLRSLWFSNNDERGGKAQVIFLIIGVVLSILAPIAVRLVALAISRKREYLADATGAKLTRYPQGLANALKKIKNEHVSRREMHAFNHAVGALCISDPFKKLSGLFATHPPVDERIRRLEAM